MSNYLNWLYSRGTLYVKATDIVESLERAQNMCKDRGAKDEEEIIKAYKRDFQSNLIQALKQIGR